jgi:hypothetical protein
MVFRLRFPESQVRQWASRYCYAVQDDGLRGKLRPVALARGLLTRDEFLAICRWKTPRSKSLCATNDEFVVRTITRAAFGSSYEALKMDLLRTLSGVEWPTASTLLNFCDRRPYPILDYRALWSLGFDEPPHYRMEFWLEYLGFTRRLAKRLKVDIRTLDQALWQYSKARQRPRMRPNPRMQLTGVLNSVER